MPEDRRLPWENVFCRERYPVEQLSVEEQERLRNLAAGAQAADSASVAANPSDPAFWMLLDGRASTPVVHLDGCYICEDPEFAAMGLPLCSPCPQCVRERMELCPACHGTRGLPDGPLCVECRLQGYSGTMGHVAADDVVCDECGYEHGPGDYDGDGLILGVPRPKALFIRHLRGNG